MPLLAAQHADELANARCRDPFAVLGVHAEADGVWLRVWRRGAIEVAVVARESRRTRYLLHQAGAPGLFEARIPRRKQAFAYELAVQIGGIDGEIIERDPYSFWPQLSDFDLGLLRSGHHLHLGKVLGAHAMTIDGCAGVRFAVWAPNAESVSVVGDWNDFDARWHPMRLRPDCGVWELFIPQAAIGMRYKYQIRGPGGEIRIKADPCALQAEVPPATASVISDPAAYTWGDAAWMQARAGAQPKKKPLAIYECHLGSWDRRAEPDCWPNYRELAPKLIAHLKNLGFTHLELLPLAQHPFEGSWGYQVSGQFAPNSRHGSPADLKWFIDQFHQAGLGVIIDYVPGHFPKDDFCLARFDGTPTYEYADPREGEHKTWGTCVFNFRRPEVRNFLLAAALHWLREFHIDGLRVDAVSSMLYRSYDRQPGEWVPNEQGGDANLEAVSFLQELTSTVHRDCPGVLTIAEESTAWAGVTAPTDMQGLGFDLKWNMGWMHDTLSYLALDPVMRSGSHNKATFHQWYAYDDAWVLPLSHDEVVHGKRSLIDKLPGDWWQRRAQLRQLLGYQIAVPGRKLLFQGGEFGVGREFAWDRRLDWAEADEPDRKGITAFLRAALALYRDQGALHEADDERGGFEWIDCENRAESLLAFLRRAPGKTEVLVACNFTPIPRHDYPLGVPRGGVWREVLNSDAPEFGGSGVLNPTVRTHEHSWGAFPAHVRVSLPPLGIAFFQPR